jgi:hypothetical protein
VNVESHVLFCAVVIAVLCIWFPSSVGHKTECRCTFKALGNTARFISPMNCRFLRNLLGCKRAVCVFHKIWGSHGGEYLLGCDAT